MKEFLLNLIKRKKEQRKSLHDALIATDSREERSSIAESMNAIDTEIEEAEAQVAAIEAEEARNAQKNPPAFNPTAAFKAPTVPGQAARGEDPLSTMEYRTAFMAYVQNGTQNPVLQQRADAEHVSGDLGILLPNTIVNEIIKGVEHVYGQLYSRVKKTNVKGGVQYPIGAFSATMYWDGTAGTDTEHGVSEKQKTGGITGYVQFTYHIGEIRIAQSLLQSVVTVEAFEAEIVKALVEAYVKAMDEAILNGDGTKQPEGILTEAAKVSGSRIPALNIITFSATDIADWTQWQKKLFAKIPLSMRGLRPEFVMTPETWESNIMTLADDNNRPVYRETYNPTTGDETATFKGRNVVFVEEGGIKSFDGASTGDIFGMLWVPEKAYAINSNMQFGYKKYFDEETNQWITKALVICDGKVLDGKYIYLLKKGA
jgi:HK97 family phage major capsid protein